MEVLVEIEVDVEVEVDVEEVEVDVEVLVEEVEVEVVSGEDPGVLFGMNGDRSWKNDTVSYLTNPDDRSCTNDII